MNATPSTQPSPAPDPLFVRAVPIGEIRNPADPKSIIEIDQAAADRIVDDFASDPARRTVGVLVDFDHQSHNPRESTAAAAWAKDLVADRTGVFARLELTDVGRDRLAAGGAAIEPYFAARDLIGIAPGRFRPKRITSFGIVDADKAAGTAAILNRAESSTVAAAAHFRLLCRSEAMIHHGLTRSQAIEAVKERRPDLFEAWLEAGGSTL